MTIVLAAALSALFLVVRRWPLALAIAVAICTYLYVQFYFFVWDYGALDGSPVDWNAFRVKAGAEIALLLALIATVVFRQRPVLYFGTRLLIAAVVLQAVGLAVSSRFGGDEDTSRTELAGQRGNVEATVDSFSRERNVIILLVDTLQGDFLERFINEQDDIRSAFDGFRVYRNASGVFPYTSLSQGRAGTAACSRRPRTRSVLGRAS